MDLRHLRHFVTAARLGSMTAASRALDVSQPALSKSIRSLERNLGLKLVERSRQGVKPTPSGQAILAHAQAIEAEVESLGIEVQALKRGGAGVVRIGCGPSEATALLPMALSAVLKERPRLRFSVLYGLAESLIPWVRQGTIEFALAFTPAFSAEPDLIQEPLYSEAGCVVVRSGHPLARKPRLTPGDLASYSWVLGQRQPLDRRWFENFFLSRAVKEPDVVIETTSTILMKSLISTGDFITLLPRDLTLFEQSQGIFRELKVEGLSWGGSVSIVRRRRGSLSQGSTALIENLRRVAREHFPRVTHTAASARRPAKRRA